jgi:hypothetical protein
MSHASQMGLVGEKRVFFFFFFEKREKRVLKSQDWIKELFKCNEGQSFDSFNQ